MLRFVFILSLASLASSPALADWSAIPSNSFTLPAPPATGSSAHRQELETLLRFQETRTEAQCALARSQPHPEFGSLFGAIDLLREEERAASEEVVSRAMQLSERIAGYHKAKFRRPRPYSVEPRLSPCAARPSGATSYPSSHASAAATGACVLAALLPARSEALLRYGQSLGDLRFVVGVHHPSDVQAGQALGRELCQRLLADPEFNAELQEVRRSVVR